jgi:hypothetical protein
MERATFNWLKSVYGVRFNVDGFNFEDIEWNLKAAIVMSRLRYHVVPEPLPPSDDIIRLGEYWKKYYNTVYGAGTVQKFVQKYNKYVLGR